MKLKILHHFRDVVDSRDESPFKGTQEAHIDEGTHTIRNVCVFGTRHSKNGYDYENPAIDRLTALTEGAKFFINHPSKSEAKDRDGVRDIRDWAGVYSKPRKEGEDKVFADLRVRPAFWELVRDVAIMKPPGVGNSINSRVKVYKDQAGKEHIVDIDTLKSIDLVASAATTSNLFESQGDEEDMDITLERILEDGADQAGMVYQLVRETAEGLLADKIKERETERKIRDLQWKVEDAIADVLKDKAKDMKAKKVAVTAILNDFEGMVNDILAGKKVAGATEENIKEDDEMEFGKLNLEDLTKERPDLVKMIKDSMKVDEEMTRIKTEHAEMKPKLEAAEKRVTELASALEAMTKERDDLKKRVDEYEAKEKGAKKEAVINAKIDELKVPKDAVTDVFRTTLMGMEEKEMVEALNDRKAIYLKGQKGVRNNGQEYTIKTEGGDEDFSKKQEKAEASVLAATGR